MTTLELPENAVLSARERAANPAPGAAQRGSTLTGGSSPVQGMFIPNSGGQLVVECVGPPPEWITPTVEKLERILKLPSNWDSYGARKINPACVVAALETAFAIMRDGTPSPTVVPLSSGGVQLEWHTHGIDLEIEFRSPVRILASCENHRTGETWEEQVFDFSRIRNVLREMALS